MQPRRTAKSLLAHIAFVGLSAIPLSAVQAQGRPPLPPDARTKYCVALYSHNFNRSNSKPIHYKYKWCKSNQDCTNWTLDTIESGDTAYVSQIKCYNTTSPVKLKIQYDWKFLGGYQRKAYDLAPQTFPYVRNRLPNSGCIRSGAYHFVSKDDTLHLYRGVPKGVKRESCRWRDSD